MNRFVCRILLAAACVAAGQGTGAADAPADTLALYSHRTPLTFQGSGSLVQLRLPKDVYLYARSPTLDDLRVFDSHGRKVPFALTMPLTQRGISHRTTPTKVFALDADADISAGKVTIRTSADGSLLSVESRAGNAPPVQPLAGLLIDLNLTATEQTMVNALVFSPPPGVDNYSARVTLEASDDLQVWAYVAEAPLNWLNNGAKDTLANNRIAFGARPMRYVRLRWLEGKPLPFGAIDVERELVDAVAYAQDSMVVAAQPGVFPGDWTYPIGLAVPVRSLGLQLDAAGVVIPSEIGRYVELPTVHGAAAQPASRWQFVPLLRTTFYRIAQDGSIRTPPDLAVGPWSLDRLVVRPLTPSAIAPALRVSWLPATLIFAAREAGPYTLAVGRDHASSAQSALSDVAPGYRPPELLTIAQAAAGPVLHQQPVAQEASDAQRAGLSATARTAVLWGVLLLGVLVLALISWKMVKQLRAGDADRDV